MPRLALNIVRVGSARTRWGAYSTHPKPIGGLGVKDGREGKGWKRKERRGEREGSG